MSLSNPRRRASGALPGQDIEAGLSLKASSILRKGATFHSPSSPSSDSDDTFVPPGLHRSSSHMDDVVDANRRRIALTLTEIDEALAQTEHLSLSPKKSNKDKDSLRDTSLPIPRGFLDMPVVDPAMAKDKTERRVLRPRSIRRTNNHASDSGLGSSLASTTKEKLVSDTKKTSKKAAATAITRSAASASMEALPALSRKAYNRIHEHTLGPLLEKATLKDFEPIVLDVPRRIRSKEIICLRDLEKTLLFMAPEKAKSAALYLDFCFTSIRCIQATVEYLSDREQVRPGDRPYTNGYFLDLKEQILQYGRDLAVAKGDGEFADNMQLDQYVPCFVPLDAPTNKRKRADEIKLYGGIAENGRPAELVRFKKDGTAISMATGKPVDIGEGPGKIKRSLSEQREDDEEIMRSMARRKKNATPEELAPKKCREIGCNKEFKRPCDLTKHEKTHSRPWKCPMPTCKYHEFGWPTEKEMDRHINDKHSDKPAMYECQFKPCPYKSKRESNCKQHMEKAHGWTYVRTKTNGGRKLSTKPDSSVQQTPPLGNASTPSDAYSVPTPPQDGNSAHALPNDFPLYPADADWLATYGLQPESLENMDLTPEQLSPSSAGSYEQYQPYQNGSQFITDEDIYAAAARIPAHHLTLHDEAALYSKLLPQQHMHLQPQPQQQHAQQHAHQQAVSQLAQAFDAPQQCAPAPAVAPHFSPNAQQNAMLYTPNSLGEMDEGLEEAFANDGADFQLFPANITKGNNVQSLFGEMPPSTDLGFSQTTQPEIFQQLDLSQLDYQGFSQ
jgi:hypothetical protein